MLNTSSFRSRREVQFLPLKSYSINRPEHQSHDSISHIFIDRCPLLKLLLHLHPRPNSRTPLLLFVYVFLLPDGFLSVLTTSMSRSHTAVSTRTARQTTVRPTMLATYLLDPGPSHKMPVDQSESLHSKIYNNRLWVNYAAQTRTALAAHGWATNLTTGTPLTYTLSALSQEIFYSLSSTPLALSFASSTPAATLLALFHSPSRCLSVSRLL